MSKRSALKRRVTTITETRTLFLKNSKDNDFFLLLLHSYLTLFSLHYYTLFEMLLQDDIAETHNIH